MKKLFFLCAFLFMYMQIQAQIYIVSYDQWTTYAKDSNGKSMYGEIVETTISPDGSTYYKVIETREKATDSRRSETAIVLLQTISSTVNELIENGYSLKVEHMNFTQLLAGGGGLKGPGVILVFAK